MRTVMVYVHGLWLNGWESVLLRQTIVAAVELRRRCRSTIPRSEPDSRRMRCARGGSRLDSRPTRCTSLVTVWEVWSFWSCSRCCMLAGVARGRHAYRPAASCCSVLRFAAAALPAISRCCRSAGACSVSRPTRRCCRSASGNGSVTRARHHRGHGSRGVRAASWVHSTRPATARCWSRRRTGRGKAAFLVCARRTRAWCIRRSRAPGGGLFARGAFRGRKAEVGEAVRQGKARIIASDEAAIEKRRIA